MIGIALVGNSLGCSVHVGALVDHASSPYPPIADQRIWLQHRHISRAQRIKRTSSAGFPRKNASDLSAANISKSDASSRLMDYPLGEGGRLSLPDPLSSSSVSLCEVFVPSHKSRPAQPVSANVDESSPLFEDVILWHAQARFFQVTRSNMVNS
ncbi:unnamed protein product [Toxocara canis]|uniref:Uncharacterized protein n=1 Tax=Toxocara canis TaxID=6265 RepID=A0A183VAS8_TOXCA|nr:unnamed protein product [Toxocara canis]